LNSKGP